MKRLAIAALLGCVVQFATGHAQESVQSPEPPSAPPPAAAPPAGAEEGRFSYHRVQDSFVRLDMRTGQVATCARGPGGWTCQAAPDDRAALEAEIGRLQADNAALRKELLTRGLPLPGGVRPDPARPPVAEAPPRPRETVPPGAQSPMESEVERVKTFIGDVWRRLVEMVSDLQRDIQRRI